MKKRFLCLSLIFALAAAQVMPVAAARKDEVQAEKANTQSKLSATESKEAELEEKKNSLLGEIDSLDQNLVQVIAQIDILKGEISDKEGAITETKENLAEAEADRDEQYAAMKKRIQYLYENGGSDAWAQMLLEVNSITDLLSKAEYTEKMYQFDRDELEKLRDTVQQVTDLGNQLEQEKAELEEMKQAQEDQQVNLEAALEEKKAVASDYETQIANVQAQADEYRSLIEQQNAELQRIQEEEARQAAEAKKAKEKAAKEAEAAAQRQAQQNSANTESNTNTNNNGNTNNNNNNDDEEETETPSNNGGGGNNYVPEPETPSYEEPEEEQGGGSSATGDAVVAYASQFIGNPYVYGGNSLTNGIDCSGFTQQVFAHFGYSISRTSDSQAGDGRGISYSQSRAGDIIVYSGHVAILTGDGGIVHASNSAPYPQGGIKYSSNALYRPYIAVRRIVN
ncbi:putative endopeptidase [Blautia producta]|uniref:Putative endopeptidase n=1 Tax=Blautia producta TaxID=33035 RepID=A0A4P6LWM8_9FIRM|nr:C40 family peptidase [Blautia producta]QBE96252.1 putative endopeptidase [Blautia producta]